MQRSRHRCKAAAELPRKLCPNSVAWERPRKIRPYAVVSEGVEQQKDCRGPPHPIAAGRGRARTSVVAGVLLQTSHRCRFLLPGRTRHGSRCSCTVRMRKRSRCWGRATRWGGFPRTSRTCSSAPPITGSRPNVLLHAADGQIEAGRPPPCRPWLLTGEGVMLRTRAVAAQLVGSHEMQVSALVGCGIEVW